MRRKRGECYSVLREVFSAAQFTHYLHECICQDAPSSQLLP